MNVWLLAERSRIWNGLDGGGGQPRIDGVVRSVSVDSLHDQQTGMSYDLAEAEVDRKNLLDFGPNIHLVAGMPAEVLIVTEQHSLLGYLSQLFRRALGEV